MNILFLTQVWNLPGFRDAFEIMDAGSQAVVFPTNVFEFCPPTPTTTTLELLKFTLLLTHEISVGDTHVAFSHTFPPTNAWTAELAVP